MAAIPRIVAVDDTDQIGRILRGAMILIDRRFILVEVPTAEGGLEELRNSQIDLLVTAYALPDFSGIELANRAIRESAGTPVIVLANAVDELGLDEDKLANLPYTILVRPAGEQFLRALRVGLDGQAAVSFQEVEASGSGGLDLGSVPAVDEPIFRQHLMPMMRETSALGAFIADRQGRIICTEGITGYFDIQLCAATLGSHFAHTVELRDLIGGNAACLQYFDGENYDIFALALGLHYFVVLIFDGTKRPAFGPVTNYGRREADAIIEKIGAEAWTFRRQVMKMTQTMPSVASLGAMLETLPEPVSIEVEPPAPQREPDLELEPLTDFDPELLFGQNIDENSFDNLFSDDDLNQTNAFIAGENSVSFTEAMDMGILDD